MSMDFRRNFESSNVARRSTLVPAFLSFIPGLIGFAILIAAVVMSSWTTKVIANGSSVQFQTFGLFSVCKNQVTRLTTPDQAQIVTNCVTREEEAPVIPIDPLEQATRSLVIIAIIVLLPGIITAIYFGLYRNVRKYSSIIIGCIFMLAAVCALSGMASYSAYLSNQATAAFVVYTRVEAGLAFILGWVGTGFAFLASITAFTSHAIY